MFLKISAMSKTYVMSSRNISLLATQGFIDGKWVKAKNGSNFNVYNPANGKLIEKVPNMDVEDVEFAIKAASNAFEKWSQTTAKERSMYLRKLFNVIEENSKNIAEILSTEAGKPIAEAGGEVVYGNSFIEWFSEEARHCYGDILPKVHPNKELIHIRQPIGVTALITPWNFPLAMITRKAGAALAAGCTCVIKPAEDTPLTALAFAKCAEIAGIPNGVINVVTTERGKAGAIGSLLCKSPLVAGVTFTGSTAVGKRLYEQCSFGVKRLSLELGGNAPFIVFSSADICKAIEGTMISKFRNCGQTCVSSNRFLIQDKIFDEFVSKLKEKIRSTLELGDPAVKTTVKERLGPLINQSQIRKVDEIVGDAVKKGAVVHCGGKRAEQIGELFYEPTLLTNITPNMMCYSEEIFGPVIACISFTNEDEAINISNNSLNGLAGYFYSNDLSQVWRVARKLQVGMVGVNEGMISTPEAAFGGIKESGIGREGSRYGLDEFTYIKYVCFGNL